MSEFEFPRRERDKIQRAARRAEIFEVCFAVFGRGKRVARAVRLRNRSKSRLGHHAVHLEDIRRARARLRRPELVLLGILHSHPLSHAAPGSGDLEGYRSGSLIFIYSDIYDELRAFRLRDGQAVEHGVRIIEK